MRPALYQSPGVQARCKHTRRCRLSGDGARQHGERRGRADACTLRRRRELDREDRAASGSVGGGDRAAVLLDDAVGDRQPEARALVHFLRREERIEDPRQHLLVDARTAVADPRDDRRAVRGRLDGDVDRPAPAAVDDRVLGVDQHVEEGLLKQQRVAGDGHGRLRLRGARSRSRARRMRCAGC